MSKLAPVIEVIASKCVNCHSCIDVCPAKYCNTATNDHVEVNADLCIGCGSCITACTHDARRGRVRPLTAIPHDLGMME